MLNFLKPVNLRIFRAAVFLYKRVVNWQAIRHEFHRECHSNCKISYTSCQSRKYIHLRSSQSLCLPFIDCRNLMPFIVPEI